MRIVGGTLGGRRFQPPANIPARPTTDMAREGLFNTLTNLIDFEDCEALELFAGTGAVSYELASRGASHVTAVEQHGGSVAFMKTMSEDWNITSIINVIRGDVFSFLERHSKQYDFIFADPPYALPYLDSLPGIITGQKLLKPEGIFVLEHNSRNGFENAPYFMKEKKYGDTLFSIFQQA